MIRTWLREARTAVLVSSLCGLGFQGGMIALPWVLQQALDHGITPGDRSAVVRWALVFAAVSVVLAVSETGMRWFVSLAAGRMVNRTTARLETAVLGMDAPTAARFGHGDLLSRTTRDLDAAEEWLTTVPSLLSGVAGFATVLVLVGTQSPPLLAAVGLGTLPLLVAVNLWYPRRFTRAETEVAQAHGDRAGAVEDLLSATTALRGLGGETVLVERHHAASAELLERTTRLSGVAAAWSAHAPAIPAAATGIGLAVGGLAVLDGEFSVGGLVAFAGWMTLLDRQVMMLTQRFHQLGRAAVASRRIGEVLTARPQLLPPVHPEPLPATGELVATGLRVRDLDLPDLTVAPGELVVLTGPTGSGKSTLLGLLARRADPGAGEVTFGGIELDRADPDHLRRRVTLVPQRPTLVSGSIAENLSLGHDPAPSEADLRAACRVAALDTDLAALPDGLATVLGEGGHTLSGGQVQRLALARALLRRAPVLLLDDVTSAVDATTEAEILDRIRLWSPGALVLTSSRPGVLARADRVVVLGAGDLGAGDLAEVGRRA